MKESAIVLRETTEADADIFFAQQLDPQARRMATAALRAFLSVDPTRPLFARVVKDNAGSVGVLRKCGFRPEREDRFFSEIRDMEVEEFVFKCEEAA